MCAARALSLTKQHHRWRGCQYYRRRVGTYYSHLKVYMELGSYFLFLQEQIKDIIIIWYLAGCLWQRLG